MRMIWEMEDHIEEIRNVEKSSKMKKYEGYKTSSLISSWIVP